MDKLEVIECYKLNYESVLRKNPHRIIMKEGNAEWQWISDKIKRILHQFRDNMNGVGKIKIIHIEPSIKPNVFDDTVILFFDTILRFRSKNRSIKPNIHQTVVCIKTDINTMNIDINILEQEIKSLIGSTTLNINPCRFYPKYVKISDL